MVVADSGFRFGRESEFARGSLDYRVLNATSLQRRGGRRLHSPYPNATRGSCLNPDHDTGAQHLFVESVAYP